MGTETLKYNDETETSSFEEKRITITKEIDDSGVGYIERDIIFHDNYLAKVINSRYTGVANSFNIMEVWAPQHGRSILGANAFARAKHELKLFGGYMVYNKKEELLEFDDRGISSDIELDIVKKYRFRISSVWDSYLVSDIKIMDEIWCLCHTKSFATGDRKNSYNRANAARKKFLFTAWYIEELANCVLKDGNLDDVETMRGQKGNIIIS
jgi:hypothetical protein